MTRRDETPGTGNASLAPRRIRLAGYGKCALVACLSLLWLAEAALAPAAAGGGARPSRRSGAPSEEALEADPSLMFRVALGYHQRGHYVQAISLLDRFIEKFSARPERARAVYMRADAYFLLAQSGAAGAYQRAVEAYQVAVSLYPQSPQMPTAYFRIGCAYGAQGLKAEAQVAYRTLLERAPKSPLAARAQIEIARRYLELNDPRSAIAEYGKILKNYRGTPAETEAFFGVADALFDQKLFKEALQRFEAGRNRWPTFLSQRPGYLYNYAESLFQMRRFAQAANAYLQLVNIYPTDGSVHRALARLGDIYLEQGRRADALKVYSRVLADYPESEGASIALIRLADIGVESKTKIGQELIFPSAPLRNPLAAYRSVIRRSPKSRLAEVAYLRIASYLMGRGEVREAISTLEDFLKKYPATQLNNNARILLAQAYFGEVDGLYRNREFLQAIRAYAEFRAILPQKVSRLANPYQTMAQVGESYMRLGLYAKANEMFQAILAEPEGVLVVGEEALFRSTQSALLSGDREKAKGLAARFTKGFPHSRWLASVRALLGEIAWSEGRPREAARVLTEVLKEKVDIETRGRSLYLLGDANAAIGRYGEAVDALRKAIALHPKIDSRLKPFSLEGVAYRLGDILYDARRWVSALLAYRRAISQFPESSHAGWARHRISQIQDQLDLAGRVGEGKETITGKVSDPFWEEVNSVREKSAGWDRKFRARAYDILKKSPGN